MVSPDDSQFRRLMQVPLPPPESQRPVMAYSERREAWFLFDRGLRTAVLVGPLGEGVYRTMEEWDPYYGPFVWFRLEQVTFRPEE